MDKDELITTIQQEATDLLNDSAIKTPDKGRHIANMLLQQGVQPTWRLIREVLGTGSATTLQNVVNQYWSELGERLNHLEKRADVPDGLAKEFNKLWDKALKQAHTDVEIRLKTDFAEAKSVKETAQKALTESEAKLALLLTEKNQKEANYIEEIQSHKATLQQLSSELKQRQQETKQLQILYQQTESMSQHHEQQATQLVITIDTIKQEYQTEIKQLRTEQQQAVERQAQQYESMIDHYANELGQLKVTNEKQSKQQQKERMEWKKQQENTTSESSRLQIENAMLNQENHQLKKSESRLQKNTSEQQNTLLTLEKNQSILQTRCLFYEENNVLLKEQLTEMTTSQNAIKIEK